MSEIPTISVTKEDDNSYDHFENGDGDYDLSGVSGAITDVEDMDSNDEEEFGKHYLRSNCSSRRPTATDVEDYNDSGSEDEESRKYPVLMLSLQEFLNHGISEERTTNMRVEGTVQMKEGNFLQIDKIDDCPTDNDNYSISSDDDEQYEEKSVCVDLDQMHLENNNTVEHAEHVDSSPDDSDADYSRSDCFDMDNFNGTAAACASEDEVFEISGNEEEMVVAVSSSDEDDPEVAYPTIQLKFTSKGGKKTMKKQGKSIKPGNLLQVSTNCEESLTDVEKIDLSAAEDSGDEDNSIPLARAVVVDSSENSNTELEDINVSENTSTKPSEELENYNLPPAHREMVLIQEDKNGDPITNVVAMENDFHFGLNDSQHDELLTDVEDISSALDDIIDYSTKEVTDLGQDFENAVLESSENVKASQSSKRNDFKENLTDVEEIFVSGSVRRKKNKLKSQNKSKSKQNLLHPERSDSMENCESDESNMSLRNQERIIAGVSRTAEMYNNESFTIVHEKCVNMFDVEKEKNFIKGLKECTETHTDIEYVEVDQIRENE